MIHDQITITVVVLLLATLWFINEYLP